MISLFIFHRSIGSQEEDVQVIITHEEGISNPVTDLPGKEFNQLFKIYPRHGNGVLKQKKFFFAVVGKLEQSHGRFINYFWLFLVDQILEHIFKIWLASWVAG